MVFVEGESRKISCNWKRVLTPLWTPLFTCHLRHFGFCVSIESDPIGLLFFYTSPLTLQPQVKKIQSGQNRYPANEVSYIPEKRKSFYRACVRNMQSKKDCHQCYDNYGHVYLTKDSHLNRSCGCSA